MLLCAGVCRNEFVGVYALTLLQKYISATEVGGLSTSIKLHGGKRSPPKHIRKVLAVVTGRAHSCWVAQRCVYKDSVVVILKIHCNVHVCVAYTQAPNIDTAFLFIIILSLFFSF